MIEKCLETPWPNVPALVLTPLLAIPVQTRAALTRSRLSTSSIALRGILRESATLAVHARCFVRKINGWLTR